MREINVLVLITFAVLAYAGNAASYERASVAPAEDRDSEATPTETLSDPPVAPEESYEAIYTLSATATVHEESEVQANSNITYNKSYDSPSSESRTFRDCGYVKRIGCP